MVWIPVWHPFNPVSAHRMYTPTTDNLQLVARAAPSLSMFKEGLGMFARPIESVVAWY